MKRTRNDTLKYWNGKEILRECKDKNRLCVHANVWNTCVDKPCEKGEKMTKRGEWEWSTFYGDSFSTMGYKCSECGYHEFHCEKYKYCPNCGAKMKDDEPKEFTKDELIQIFKDKFIERRAIGILEIEELIKELYE